MGGGGGAGAGTVILLLILIFLFCGLAVCFAKGCLKWEDKKVEVPKAKEVEFTDPKTINTDDKEKQ
jgi:hypothetical protein